MPQLPALSLAAIPGRRQRTLELAAEIEQRGFAGIYCPSLVDNLSLCLALAFTTHRIRFGTSITPIYTRHVADFASMASFIHEISDGRFDFGIGVSHAPAMGRLNIEPGKPLTDMRRFVSDLKNVPRVGQLPPLILATLRSRMIGLAEEIGNGLVFANGIRSHMHESLKVLSAESRTNSSFFVGNMIPTCVNDDIEAAKAVNRRTLTSYAMLPNYRNYWSEAGYQEEMSAIAAAIQQGDTEKVPHFLTDKWLADATLFGTPAMVRDGIDSWFECGVKTPIIVPSAVSGGQFQAFAEFFDIW